MNKYTVLPFLKFIQKILNKINNYYKYFKAHALPPKDLIVHGVSTEMNNLPNCFQRFKEEEMTNNAPNNVFIVGISSQNKYPKIIPNTSAKYFNGDTNETSDNLKD